ncbi:bacteriohemerythrin [Bacteroidota bacterium]
MEQSGASNSIWEDAYMLNIPSIDFQHKKFFVLWNTARKQINVRDQGQTDKILVELEEYINVHFAYEENLLELAGYEKLENHKQLHRYFIAKIHEMRNEYQYNNPELFEKLVVFLKKWFISHILHEDSDYKSVVSSYLNRN